MNFKLFLFSAFSQYSSTRSSTYTCTHVAKVGRSQTHTPAPSLLLQQTYYAAPYLGRTAQMRRKATSNASPHSSLATRGSRIGCMLVRVSERQCTSALRCVLSPVVATSPTNQGGVMHTEMTYMDALEWMGCHVVVCYLHQSSSEVGKVLNSCASLHAARGTHSNIICSTYICVRTYLCENEELAVTVVVHSSNIVGQQIQKVFFCKEVWVSVLQACGRIGR